MTVATDKGGSAYRSIHTLYTAGTVAGLADGQLLERFAARDGEAAGLAFTALVERHGPMVMRVCRGVLRDVHDAEDAFQATFLILARKAGSIRGRDSLAPWLRSVAYNVAATARSAATRRRTHESAADGARPHAIAEWTWDDIGPVVHEELDRLPGHYRETVVLCCLEGLTQQQAAQQLGWPLGTVQSRLARGRERLRVRLTRRGLAPSAWLPGMGLTTGTVPPALSASLVARTTRVAMLYAAGKMAAGVVSAPVAALTEGVLGTVIKTKLGKIAATTLLAGVAAGGAGVISHELGQPDAQPPRSAPNVTNPPPTKHDGPNAADESRRRQAELIDEVRSLREELRRVKGGMGGGGYGRVTKSTIPTIETGEIIAVQPSGRDRIWAQSLEGGAWKLYRVPKGTTALPVVNRNVLALMMDGPEVKQIATFDSASGEWHPQDLQESGKGKVIPMLGPDSAAYAVGRFVYAYSALAKRWGVLELAEGAKPTPIVSPTYIKVEDGTHLHVFSVRTGRWSDLDTEADDQ